FSSRRRHTRLQGDWSSDVCSSDLIFNSALFAVITTNASCGAVNSMHDSFTPLGGLVPLFNIQTGEVIFGGIGAGMYGMLIFVVKIGRASCRERVEDCVVVVCV